MILSDREIKALCTGNQIYEEIDRPINRIVPYPPMIQPFVDHSVKEIEGIQGTTRRVVSYGLSSYGYDARLKPKLMVFTNANASIVDPKNVDPDSFVEAKLIDHSYFVIPPLSYALGETEEYFNMPHNVVAVCLGKSTYARCGLVVNVTPLEPGWCGTVTLELQNSTPLPMIVYANEGICQFMFYRGHRPDVTYRDRAGKYQGQTGITLPKV